jgi:hypothetical protein
MKTYPHKINYLSHFEPIYALQGLKLRSRGHINSKMPITDSKPVVRKVRALNWKETMDWFDKDFPKVTPVHV